MMISTHQQRQQWAEDAETDRLIEKEIETEICQRFIRLSCEKMLNARHERGGAKLHRNLLILHLLRKARTESKRLPYECASLLKRPPMSTSSTVTRHLSAGAVSPPQEHVFLSEAEVEHEEDDEPLGEEEGQQQLIVVEAVQESNIEEDDEDVEVDVVSCDDEHEKPGTPMLVEGTTMRNVPSTCSLLDISKTQEKSQLQKQQHHIVTVGGPLEYKVRDQDESEKYKRSFRGNSLLIGHMSLESRFEPLHLPFTSSDAIEEATDVASLLDESENSKVPELSDDLDQQLQMISPPISPPDARKLESTITAGSKFFGVTPPLDFEDDDQPPQLFSCQESDDDDSGTEEDCEDEDETDGVTTKRRKRKTSTPRTTTVAEKRQCTVDADSDSGVDVDAECIDQQQQQPQTKSTKQVEPATNLISVYSTGLGTTVVPQTSVSSSPFPDQQVPVLKRIHSYPLFCK
jgi:hypothetical protein